MRNPIGVAYAALIVIESIWWFSVLAAIGAYLGFGGSPILWVNLLVLIGAGVISAWVFGGARGDVCVTVADDTDEIVWAHFVSNAKKKE